MKAEYFERLGSTCILSKEEGLGTLRGLPCHGGQVDIYKDFSIVVSGIVGALSSTLVSNSGVVRTVKFTHFNFVRDILTELSSIF